TTKFLIEVLENWIQILYSFYIYNILLMIQKRYRNLKRLGTQTLSAISDLKEVVENFNENFEWSLFFLIAYTTLEFLIYLELSLHSEDFREINLFPAITVVSCIALSFVSL